MRFTVAMLLFISIFYEQAEAVVSPDLKPAVLASVDLEVNGNLRKIGVGDSLQLVWGDRIKVLRATLGESTDTAEIVNLVGFRARSGSPDDRGVELLSHRDLNKEWSHDGSGALFRINARSQGRFFGRVYLSFKKPQLHSVVFSINGHPQRYQEQAEIRLSPSDRLKLEELDVNFSYQEGEVSYKLEPTGEKGKFQLALYRHDLAFAALRLLVSPP